MILLAFTTDNSEFMTKAHETDPLARGIIREEYSVNEYFKKLQGTDGIWEIRAKRGRNAFRFLGFLDEGRIVVLTNGFAKKTRKTPASEIALAEKWKTEYLSRKQNGRS